MMKLRMIWAGQLSAALAVGFFMVPVARAGEPALNPRELGILEAVLDVCGAVDPEAAAKLQDRIAELTKGASEDALAQVRAGDKYKEAHDSVHQLVGKVDGSKAKKVCSESMTANPSPAGQ